MFEVSVLASGSTGNCFYVGCDKGEYLIDAGISCKRIISSLGKIGKAMDDIDGIFVTHEHLDHIKGIDVISKQFNTPIYLNAPTLENCYIDMGNVQLIKTGDELSFGNLKVFAFPKMHDAAEPVGYMLRNRGKTIGIITDAGHGCDNVKSCINESDLLIMETNHDARMLKNGNYPANLKKRISSISGHLSNYQAALLVLEHASGNLRNILLSHISHHNNLPEIALDTFSTIVSERSDLKNMNIDLTFRDRPTELIKI